MSQQLALNALESAGLIRQVHGQPDNQYSIRHALIQETAYRALLRRDRAELHRTVGEVLERMFSDRLEEVAPQLADHFHQAGDEEKAFRYHWMAGDQAMRVYAHQEALGHYDMALALAQPPASGSDELWDVYLKRGRAMELSGQPEKALENYAAMEAHAGDLGQATQELRARLQSAILYCTPSAVANPPKGMGIAEETLTEARRVGDLEAEARSLWIMLLVLQYSLEHLPASLEAGEQALEIVRQLDHPDLQAYILNDLGRAYGYLGRLDSAKAVLAEAQPLWRQLENLPMLADTLANQMMRCALAGEYREALAFSGEGFRVSQSIDNLWGQACSLMFIDLVHAGLGDYRKALEAGSQCLVIGQEAGFEIPSIFANATQAWIKSDLGLQEEALAQLSVGPESPPGMLGAMASVPLSAEALLRLETGELETAEKLLEEAMSPPSQGELLLHFSSLFPMLVQVSLHLARGDWAEAVRAPLATLEAMKRQGFRFLMPNLLLLQGRALTAQGDLEHAGRVLDEGLSTAESMDSRRTLWPLLAARGEVHARIGESAKARHARERARAITREIAENVAPLGLDETFLDQAKVRAVTEA